MGLAAADPWLWLRKRVKLVELARVELVRTGLAWTEQLAGVQMILRELINVI